MLWANLVARIPSVRVTERLVAPPSQGQPSEVPRPTRLPKSRRSLANNMKVERLTPQSPFEIGRCFTTGGFCTSLPTAARPTALSRHTSHTYHHIYIDFVMVVFRFVKCSDNADGGMLDLCDSTKG